VRYDGYEGTIYDKEEEEEEQPVPTKPFYLNPKVINILKQLKSKTAETSKSKEPYRIENDMLYWNDDRYQRKLDLAHLRKRAYITSDVWGKWEHIEAINAKAKSVAKKRGGIMWQRTWRRTQNTLWSKAKEFIDESEYDVWDDVKKKYSAKDFSLALKKDPIGAVLGGVTKGVTKAVTQVGVGALSGLAAGLGLNIDKEKLKLIGIIILISIIIGVGGYAGYKVYKISKARKVKQSSEG
jgi:hypothetical protein